MFDLIFKGATCGLIAWLGSTHAQIGSYNSAIGVLLFAVIYWAWAFTDILK